MKCLLNNKNETLKGDKKEDEEDVELRLNTIKMTEEIVQKKIEI